ncbi:predicted protein, partial [Phaeodactylum tricornutum CCAP 1055/1]
RFKFIYQGNAVYEWEQSLNEVVIYIPAPKFLESASQLSCDIQANHLKLGLKGSKSLFIDEKTCNTIETAESTWCLEDGSIVLYLQKANKGLVWASALTGRFDVELNVAQLEQVRKKIMLERWQEEHPEMDFRDAEFNGSVPDPRSFMGGVGYG